VRSKYLSLIICACGWCSSGGGDGGDGGCCCCGVGGDGGLTVFRKIQ